jgi:hypothetical protein
LASRAIFPLNNIFKQQFIFSEEPGQSGELIIRAEEIDKGQKEIVSLICHGRRLTSPGLCSCCFGVDPFLEFYRFYIDGT